MEGQIAKWVLEFVVEAVKIGLEALAAKDPSKMRKVGDILKTGPMEAELVALEERAKRIAENARG
jgi:hypothetical protein